MFLREGGALTRIIAPRCVWIHTSWTDFLIVEKYGRQPCPVSLIFSKLVKTFPIRTWAVIFLVRLWRQADTFLWLSQITVAPHLVPRFFPIRSTQRWENRRQGFPCTGQDMTAPCLPTQPRVGSVYWKSPSVWETTCYERTGSTSTTAVAFGQLEPTQWQAFNPRLW